MCRLISLPGKIMMATVVALILMWFVSIAETQRGQQMRGPQAQPQQEMKEWNQYGPGMMGEDACRATPWVAGWAWNGRPRWHGHGMMCPGMGMVDPGMGMMGSGMGMAGFMHLPDFTEEQQNQIQSITREMRRQHMKVMADIMDMRDDMIMELRTERPDPEKPGK